MQSSMAINILHGVEQVAAANSLAVSFTDALQRAATGRIWARELLARRPIGVIVVHLGFSPEQHALLVTSGTPLVALDPNGEPEHGIPSVGATNRGGGIAATSGSTRRPGRPACASRTTSAWSGSTTSRTPGGAGRR